jgi:hypothetical protein
MDGTGTLTCADGRIFVGEFFCDSATTGTMSWPTGETFDGCFENNKIDKTTSGKFTFANGQVVNLTGDGILFRMARLDEYDVSLPFANPNQSDLDNFIESYFEENNAYFSCR